MPLPPGAEEYLSADNPRLAELRARYERARACPRSRWTRRRIDEFLDLRWFRGETLITWHYREDPRMTELKFFVLLEHVRERDQLGLLDRLEEDGAFGCWTYAYAERRRVSRDLLESVQRAAVPRASRGSRFGRRDARCSTSAPATVGWRIG